MHPIICKIGPLTVYSYGVMLTVAVLVCSFLLTREARKRGFSPDILLDLVFWAVMGGIIGARVFYILLNLDFYIQDPIEIIMLQHGGLAFQGGLLGGMLTGLLFIRKHSLSLLTTLDLVAPYVALGHAIGRIGCFLNGCCFGREVPWGIYFPSHQANLHPTQIYESIGLLAVFIILKKRERNIKYPGQIFIWYLVLSSALRFVNEFYRADHIDLWMGLSIFQIVSLVILFGSLYANTLIKSRSRK